MIQFIISIVYFVAGVVFANNYGYLADLSTLPHILSAVLSVALWPLLMLNVDLNVSF